MYICYYNTSYRGFAREIAVFFPCVMQITPGARRENIVGGAIERENRVNILFIIAVQRERERYRARYTAEERSRPRNSRFLMGLIFKA